MTTEKVGESTHSEENGTPEKGSFNCEEIIKLFTDFKLEQSDAVEDSLQRLTNYVTGLQAAQSDLEKAI